MAVLIPALGSCVSRMTAGERRLAERLAHKRESGYLLWHCVPTALRKKQFSFRRMDIQAQGRTTALKTNYPNTKQILQTASLVAADLLTVDDKDFAIADELDNAHIEGHAWGDMAILCHVYPTMDLRARALEQRRLPFNVRKRAGDFNPSANAIQIMAMKVSKGLEFPVVALPGVGHMPAAGKDEAEAVRVFYVAATRATQRLMVGVGGGDGLGERLV